MSVLDDYLVDPKLSLNGGGTKETEGLTSQSRRSVPLGLTFAIRLAAVTSPSVT